MTESYWLPPTGPVPSFLHSPRRQGGWSSAHSQHLHEPAQAARVCWREDAENQAAVCYWGWLWLWAELSWCISSGSSGLSLRTRRPPPVFDSSQRWDGACELPWREKQKQTPWLNLLHLTWKNRTWPLTWSTHFHFQRTRKFDHRKMKVAYNVNLF